VYVSQEPHETSLVARDVSASPSSGSRYLGPARGGATQLKPYPRKSAEPCVRDTADHNDGGSGSGESGPLLVNGG
jgi:hypothetical protein